MQIVTSPKKLSSAACPYSHLWRIPFRFRATKQIKTKCCH